jgi:DASH complex subunit DAD2
VKIPKPKDTHESEDAQKVTETEAALPQTLVRIPTEHAPILQQQSGAVDENDGE